MAPLFWAYFIAALRMTREGVGEAALAAPQFLQPPPIKVILIASINEIATGYSGKQAAAYAHKVKHWIGCWPGERWVVLSLVQFIFSVPTQTIAVWWWRKLIDGLV
jgi:hypothetical protein